MIAKKTSAVKKKVPAKSIAAPKRKSVSTDRVDPGKTILSLVMILIISTLALTGFNLAAINAYNANFSNSTTSDLADYGTSQDANVAFNDITDVVKASTDSQITFVSDSSNQCFSGVYDSFNQAVNSNGINYNSFDTNKWANGSSNGSTATTQNGQAVYFATGSSSKSLFGTVFTTKKAVAGDFSTSITLTSMGTNDSSSARSLTEYKLSTWQKLPSGVSQAELTVYTNNKGQRFVGLYQYSSNQIKTFIYDKDGVQNDVAVPLARPIQIDGNLPVILRLERTGNTIKGYYTIQRPGETAQNEVLVGQISNFNKADTYLTHGFTVLGQDQTLVATANNFYLKGCFAQ